VLRKDRLLTSGLRDCFTVGYLQAQIEKMVRYVRLLEFPLLSAGGVVAVGGIAILHL
jgi:hypothetical protein